MSWQIRGEYFENCNCDILCPCLTSSMQGPADSERCMVPMICHIREGFFNDVALNGLNFVMMIDAPAVMAEGNWRAALYIDERADEHQREAIQAILSGKHGGVPEVLSGLVGEQMGVKYVPIAFEQSGLRWRAEVPDIMEFEVQGVTSPGSDQAMEVINIGHPMGNSLPIAKSLKGQYNDKDFDFAFDNTGKNAHYREFEWQGG